MITYTTVQQPDLDKRTLLQQVLERETTPLLCLALIKFLVHMAAGANYGFFRDELYYIDAGKHLAFGYVEFPPMIAWLAALIRILFGSSLLAYHILPAIAGAGLVLLTGLIARELGGGRFAQSLAALASLVATTFLGIDSIFSMDSFDELLWVLAAYVLLLLIERNQPRLWLLFGLVVGFGLLNKLTILSFGFAIVVGLLLTTHRKLLLSKWAWLGGIIAFAFLVPYVLWNAANSWATIEFWQSYSNGHANPSSMPGFVYQQIVTMNPLTLPLWLGGLYYYFFTQQGRPYRVFGWTFVILFVLFMLTRAKLYFLSPAYPMLFAAGALLVVLMIRRYRWLGPTYIALLTLVGLALAPIAMPILPPAPSAWMNTLINGNGSLKVENRTTGQLPQQLADRFGWESMVATIAHVYAGLSPAERAKACIFAENYGEAGAIDLYGAQYHLPPAISGHNTYYLWGPGTCTGEVVISIGSSAATLQTAFTSVVHTGTTTCSYCMPAEDNLPVYVCRHLKTPLQAVWPDIKHYD